MLAASVIIPCRNKLETLTEVLRNLRHQKFPLDAFEVVVIDDESTDGTRPFLRRLADAGALPHIAVEELVHADVCPAKVRNRGLARARGDLIIFLDSDVLVGPDFIGEHVGTHQAAGGDTAVIGYVHAYPLQASERTPEKIQAPPIGEVVQRLPQLLREDPRHWKDGREAHYRIWPDMAACPMPWLFFWGGNSSVRRQLVLDLGGFDDGFKNWGFEDVELGYRLWKARVPFTLHRPAWGFHYPHPTGSDARRFENLFQFLRKHPEPYVELNCFASTHFQEPGAARVRWETLDRQAAPPPRPPAPPSGLCTAIADFLGGPLAWFGELPDPAPIAAALISHPFRADAPPGRAALTGLALPHPDGSFAAAVLMDYWHHLSEAALRFVCAEVTRVAGTCLLVSSRPPPAEADDRARAVAGMPGYRREDVEISGLRAHLVRRGPVS